MIHRKGAKGAKKKLKNIACLTLCVLCVFAVIPVSFAFAGERPDLYWEKRFSGKVERVVFNDGKDGFPIDRIVLDDQEVLYGADGNELRRVERSIEKVERVENRLFAPDNSYFVLYSYKEGSVDFYESNGKVIKRHNVNDFQSLRAKYSANGDFLIMNLMGNKNEQQILLFDRNGDILWRFDWVNAFVNFDISASGEKIVIASEKRLAAYVNDRDSGVKVIKAWEQELVPGGNEIAISRKGDFIALSREANSRVLLMDANTGKIRWKADLKGVENSSKLNFTGMEVSGSYLMVSAKRTRYTDNKESYLYLFDLTGELVWKKEFEEREVATSFEDDFIVVQGDRSVRLFSFSL